MKLLLDECVPRRLKTDLNEHEVVTVGELGLTGVLDSEMLQAASPCRYAQLKLLIPKRS